MAFKKAPQEMPDGIPALTRSTGFSALMSKLMAKKGVWFLIATDEWQSTAARLKKMYPDFEFAARTPEGRDSSSKEKNKDIYSRFVDYGTQKHVDD